jgi:hypothetical protein
MRPANVASDGRWFVSEVAEETKRTVSIHRDGEDYVAVFQPENVVIFRNRDAPALRKVCRLLRWDVLNDTLPELDYPA